MYCGLDYRFPYSQMPRVPDSQILIFPDFQTLEPAKSKFSYSKLSHACPCNAPTDRIHLKEPRALSATIKIDAPHRLGLEVGRISLVAHPSLKKSHLPLFYYFYTDSRLTTRMKTTPHTPLETQTTCDACTVCDFVSPYDAGAPRRTPGTRRGRRGGPRPDVSAQARGQRVDGDG